MLRNRREERRKDRQAFRPGGAAIQYQMTEKLASIGEFEPGQDVILMLANTVALEKMSD